MKQPIACNRKQLIEKLRDQLNFLGPVTISQRQYMSHNGQMLAIPPNKEFTVSQFRTLVKEVDQIVSSEEWRF